MVIQLCDTFDELRNKILNNEYELILHHLSSCYCPSIELFQSGCPVDDKLRTLHQHFPVKVKEALRSVGVDYSGLELKATYAGKIKISTHYKNKLIEAINQIEDLNTKLSEFDLT